MFLTLFFMLGKFTIILILATQGRYLMLNTNLLYVASGSEREKTKYWHRLESKSCRTAVEGIGSIKKRTNYFYFFFLYNLAIALIEKYTYFNGTWFGRHKRVIV